MKLKIEHCSKKKENFFRENYFEFRIRIFSFDSTQDTDFVVDKDLFFVAICN